MLSILTFISMKQNIRTFYCHNPTTTNAGIRSAISHSMLRMESVNFSKMVEN
jgi:hypothetical protein